MTIHKLEGTDRIPEPLRNEIFIFRFVSQIVLALALFGIGNATHIGEGFSSSYYASKELFWSILLFIIASIMRGLARQIEWQWEEFVTAVMMANLGVSYSVWPGMTFQHQKSFAHKLLVHLAGRTIAAQRETADQPFAPGSDRIKKEFERMFGICKNFSLIQKDESYDVFFREARTT